MPTPADSSSILLVAWTLYPGIFIFVWWLLLLVSAISMTSELLIVRWAARLCALSSVQCCTLLYLMFIFSGPAIVDYCLLCMGLMLCAYYIYNFHWSLEGCGMFDCFPLFCSIGY